MNGTILYIWLLLILLVVVGVGSMMYFVRMTGKNASKKYVSLLGAFTILCLVVGIVTAQYPRNMKDTFVNSSIDIMEKNQESTASYINEEMDLNKSQMRMIAGMLEERLSSEFDRSEIVGLMNQMKEAAGFVHLGLLPMEQVYPFALTCEGESVSIRIELLENLPADGEVDVSYQTSTFLSNTSGSDAVLFRTLLKDHEGNSYLLIAEKPVTVLDSILNQSDSQVEGMASVLCRRNGNIVYGGGEIDGSALVSYNLFSYLSKKGVDEKTLDGLRNVLQTEDAGHISMDIEDQKYFLVYREVKSTNWVIVSLYAETYLSGSNLDVVNTRTLHLVLIVVVMLMMAMVLALVAAHLILKQKSEQLIMEKEHLFEEMSRYIPSAFVILKDGCSKPDFVSENLSKVLNCPPPSSWTMDEIGAWLGVRITQEEIAAFLKSGTLQMVIVKNEAFYKVGFYDIGVIEGSRSTVLVLEDITEQVNSRNLLENSMARADAASRSKSAFLSKMSHEIRTPLNAVLGFSKLALEDWDTLSKDELHEYMEKIQTSGDYLLDLVSDILDISRIEEGRMSVNAHPVHLDSLIEEVSSSFDGQMKRKNIQFVVDKENTDVVLKLDQVHVRQILNNLLSNACKYTPDGGCVGLEVHVSPLSENNMSVQFIVQDTGIGMSKEFCTKIFDPFTQDEAGMNMKNQMRGSGLGMSICKNLVQMLGGTIHVESEVGEGSTFTVQFSFQKDVADTVAEEKKPVKDLDFLKGNRVLVVDDVEVNRQIMEKILTRYGMVVDLAENGQIAVEKFEKKTAPYYCIFMDIRMPILDGYEATKKIRSCGASDAKTVVISAMSADAMSEEVNKSLMAGMNYHLTKPVQIDRVLEVLASIKKKGEQA